MDAANLANQLRTQLRERPYLTLAGLVGLGLFFGRRLPVRTLVALGGIGARAALASALEAAVFERSRS